MESKLLKTEMKLGDGTYIRFVLMRDVEKYCDKIIIEGNEYSLEKGKSFDLGWLNEEQPFFKGYNEFYSFYYQLKDEVTFLPEKAMKFFHLRNVTVPEGIKTLKPDCFLGCCITGDLILPKSLERISRGAISVPLLGNCKIPESVKYLYGLPYKPDSTFCAYEADELILHEGLLEFAGLGYHQLKVNHLHIPSTLRKIELEDQYWMNKFYERTRITIAPGNRYLELRDGIICKKEK